MFFIKELMVFWLFEREENLITSLNLFLANVSILCFRLFSGGIKWVNIRNEI